MVCVKRVVYTCSLCEEGGDILAVCVKRVVMWWYVTGWFRGRRAHCCVKRVMVVVMMWWYVTGWCCGGRDHCLCEEGDGGGDDAVVCHRMVLRRESSLLARGRLMVSKAKSATSSSQLTDEVDGDCTPIVTADALPKLDFSHVGQCV